LADCLTLWCPFALAFCLGGLIGAVELFQRYKADPLEAIFSLWGGVFVLLNGLASLAAYGWWYLSNQEQQVAPTTLESLQWSAVCGLGAAAILRTKFMNLKGADNKEIALGPEIILQSLLKVIDRQLDRARAQTRYSAVMRIMKGIDFDKVRVALPMGIYQAMQSVTDEEFAELTAKINELDEIPALMNQDKANYLGFLLLDLAGETLLGKAIQEQREGFTVSEADGAAG